MKNEIEYIQNKIYVMRNQRVMLDFDLASMYGVQTKVLNQAVKRNIERFPEDFMFQLTKGELELLRTSLLVNRVNGEDATDWKSQFVTSNSIIMGLRKCPYAFTENGVAMLSSVLRSPLAIQVNINIMRAFTAFRCMTTKVSTTELKNDIVSLRNDYESLKLYIEDILHDQNDINESMRAQLDAISMVLAELQSKDSIKRPRRKIGFVQDEE